MIEFEKYLLRVKTESLTRKKFDYRRWQMDMALKQEFLDEGIRSGSYQEYNLGNEDIPDLEGFEASDGYSDLYNPLLLRFFRTYLMNIANICFPANGDWVDIKRTYSEFFHNTGIEDFLPFVNEGWVNILKTINQRYGMKEKYKTALAEFISYGMTVLTHPYNAVEHYVDVVTPGIGNAGIFPVVGNWKRSNICYYYDVDYVSLLSREDLDQEILMSVLPSETVETSQSRSYRGSTRASQDQDDIVPFGQIRCYDFFLPSVVYKGEDGEYVTMQGVYVTALIKPRLKSNAKIPKKEIYILKMTEGVSEIDHGIMFAKFNTDLPGVFYSQGALQPYLPHQYIANQFMSEISRSVGMTTDPPKTRTGVNGLMVDNLETPLEPFVAGGVYDNVEIRPIIDGGVIGNNLQVFLAYMDWLERTLEAGLGVSKNQSGALHLGRKTATEINEAYSGGQLTMTESSSKFDEQALRPSDYVRVAKTQQVMMEQIEGLEDANIEDVLANNPLFMKNLNFSGIQPNYEEYWKRKTQEYLDDMEIVKEIERMVAEGHQLLQFADSPIPPMPKIPQLKDPVTGQMVPTFEEISALEREWVQGQTQAREEARQKAKDMEFEIEKKKVLFKDVKQPPPPSLFLYYQMLVAPIADSDVIATGAMTSVSKSLAKENLLMLVNSLPAFPAGTVSKVDFDNILTMLGRANDIPQRDLLKDTATIAREEEAAAKQAEFEREMVMQASQGKPGAQPPVIPQGARV